jgi:hypothetical protein
MIMTVLTENGRLQEALVGDRRSPEITKQPLAPGQFRSGVVAGPGQTVMAIEVPDKFTSLFTTDPAGLMTQLDTLMKQRGLL